MEVKTIKDVDDATWNDFKAAAARSGTTLGQMFKSMLREYEKESKEFWDEILGGKRIISDDEAEAILAEIKKFRHSKGFR